LLKNGAETMRGVSLGGTTPFYFSLARKAKWEAGNLVD
jgi:hypothetical protein